MFTCKSGFGFLQQQFHFFHHLERSGTMFQILFVHVHVFNHSLLGKMREAGAIVGPHFIYRTHIGIQVEELAGFRFVEPIAQVVFPQPFFLKILYAHVQECGNAFQVFAVIGRRHGFAAVRATQAIYFMPNFLVKPYG